jgi:putative DNA primase/helicase
MSKRRPPPRPRRPTPRRFQRSDPKEHEGLRDPLQAALRYAACGFGVFPVFSAVDGACQCKDPNCSSPAKHPKVLRGVKAATTDEKQVREWWGDLWPGSNIGIATGAQSGITVLDVDPRHGGDRTLAELEEQHGRLPRTPTAKTGGGGEHVVLKHPGKRVRNRAGFMPGLDIRGDGGYIVAPPSLHVSGGCYEWRLAPWDVEVAEAPDWLWDMLSVRPSPRPRQVDAQHQQARVRRQDVELVPEGERNETLTSLAGTMRRRGMTEVEICAALQEVNSGRCDPPLPEEEVERVAHSISQYPPAPKEFHHTDLGNARRLAHRHGADLMFVSSLGWFAWDGQRWRKDDTGAVERLAKETVLSLYAEAAALQDDDARQALVTHARRSESAFRISAMVNLARSEPPVVARAEDLDVDPFLLTVLNGTVDLRTGQRRPHRREDRITKLAPVEYCQHAEAPRFLSFLKDIFAGNERLIGFAQRAVGYALTGDVSEHALFYLYGMGANGKSTLLLVLLHILGEYAQQAAPNLLVSKRGEEHPTSVADLFGARLVVTTEIDSGRTMAESLVKQLVGGDKVKARYMRQDFFQFDPTFKVFLAANHKLLIKGTDHAMWRRIRMLPFTVTIPESRQDRQLVEKLKQEAPGILAWAVRGCLDWQRHGLGAPEEVVSATAAYREEMDTLSQFLDECCDVGEGRSENSGKLYRAYVDWCQRAGEYATSHRVFGERLTERGFHAGKGAGGTRIRHGLELTQVAVVAVGGGLSRIARSRFSRKGRTGN